MANQTRSRGSLGSPGPYLAEITSHLDTTYMGGLEVALIKGVASVTENQGETYIVRYLSPFAGSTSVRFEGTDPAKFNDVQKSYGFWMIPPDVGSRVMVIFIDGDPNQGYWIGCIQDMFQNHMVPGLAASENVLITEEQRRKYGTSYLPVAEFLKATQKLENPNIKSIPKPIHPFADRLVQQGLLIDTTRGVTSSSARREVPSGVFGISTPGPLDPNGRKGKIGYREKNIEVPISRLGGTTFVMDDGDPTGENELVRLRTRTGHQILLHNSQDLIYIANSKGTAWIELTSNGKIDIFAEDSVSIHTENDFNFRADRDINIEAGRNIHIKANKNMETNVVGYYYLTVDDNCKISVRGTHDETINQTARITVGQNLNFNTANSTLITSGTGLDLKAGSYIKETAGRIDLNGPTAATADAAEVPPDLPLFGLPNRSVPAGWANSNFYKTADLKSIMQRVPTHEPWPQHENYNPVQFSAQATDVTLADRTKDGIAPHPTRTTSTNVTSTTPTTPQQETTTPPKQEPANPPQVTPGTCDASYAKAINNSSAQQGIQALKDAATKLGLTNPNAQAALLGIAGGECNWKVQKENFNYSADRLLQVFPSVFKGDRALAEKYAGNPNNSLPEFLYGADTSKGKGLGNTEPGDGAKFIGRGYIQLTGRSNYARYSQKMYEKGLVSSPNALVDNPELVNDPKIAAEVSVLYFQDRVKTSQDDPGYFEKACKAVGYNTSDIKARKQGYYECFAAQSSGKTVGTGSGGILTDSSGNPVRTGSGG